MSEPTPRKAERSRAPAQEPGRSPLGTRVFWRVFFALWIAWSGYWLFRLRAAASARRDAAVLELLMWGVVLPLMIAGAAQMFLGRRGPPSGK